MLVDMECEEIELNGKKIEVLAPAGSPATPKVAGMKEDVNKKKIKELLQKTLKD